MVREAAEFLTIGARHTDFEMAKSIVAALDVVIFDDGEVIGPDRAAMVKNIRARRAAASEITSMVQALINHGEDPTAKLESIASLSPVSEDDLVGKWSVRIARMLLRSRHIRGDLDLLKALPDIDFRHVG